MMTLGASGVALHAAQRAGQGKEAGVFSWIDETLEAFLRASVPLSAVDIDVSFVPP